MVLGRPSAEFPFVEWGGLLPRKRFQRWIEEAHSGELLRARLAGQVCGEWARQIFLGSFPTDPDLSPSRRVQFNVGRLFSEEPSVGKPALAGALLPPTREYIVQVGAAMDACIHAAEQLQAAGHSVSVLFDRSGGRGLLPDAWPDPTAALRCGYAGGLGPDNLQFELERLSCTVGDRPIWIDMQKNVRAADGRLLDLTKWRSDSGVCSRDDVRRSDHFG